MGLTKGWSMHINILFYLFISTDPEPFHGVSEAISDTPPSLAGLLGDDYVVGVSDTDYPLYTDAAVPFDRAQGMHNMCMILA